MPLAQQTEIEERVSTILALKKENPDADVSALESGIDQLACPPKPRRRRVYQLYDLTDEEIKIVEGKS